MFKQLQVIAGFLVLAAGLVGLLIPVIPGALLIVAGVGLVGADHPWLQPLIGRLRARLKRWLPTKTSM
jgi:uncharacterized protein YqgC (DUF456 family)